MNPAKLHRLLDQILAAMIDEWYENVSGYYATSQDESSPAQEPELKRFHDDKGHRIKFAKESLQCTYGLRVIKEKSQNRIEISVNNKVESFDYDQFLERLGHHYSLQGKTEQRSVNQSDAPENNEIFLLDSDLEQDFLVERSDGKADVVRLSFRVDPEKMAALAEEPGKLKSRIEGYCLSPLRRIYADLYRRSLRRD